MQQRERLRRIGSGCAGLVLGTCFVLGIIVAINQLAKSPAEQAREQQSQIAFERKKPAQEKPRPQPKPKPKPRRALKALPNPLADLGTALSGIQFDLPGLDSSALNAFNDELLGGGDDVVLTEEVVDKPPRPTFQAPLQYPPGARARGTEGYVVVSLLIGITGEVQQVEIIESQPEGVFEEAVLAGINQWKFEPAAYQGQTVRAWARQRIRFDLS